MTDFDRDSMLEMFTHEMSQLIAQLESTIVQSESEYNSDQINEIFRIMHTIKGSAAMMMFDSIAGVAHVIEDLFYYMREEEPQGVDYGRLSDYVLSGVDFIKAELNKLQNGAAPDGNGSELSSTIENFLRELKMVTVSPEASLPAQEAPPPANPIIVGVSPDIPKPSSSQPLNKYHGKVFFQNGCEMENIRAFTLVHNLGELTDDIIHTPIDIVNEASINMIRKNGFEFKFTSPRDYDFIHNHLSQTAYLQDLILTCDNSELNAQSLAADENVKEPEELPVISASMPQIEAVQPIAPPLSSKAQAEAEKAVAAEEVVQQGKGSQSMISVNVNKLDTLLNILSELVMTEAMVTQNPELEGLQLESFNKDAHQLRKIISNLQQAVMSMRMVPVSAIFFKMHRLVRDMCRQLNKDVQLDIIGEEIEADKNIIEQITDPIMHIIRNSIDHGVELPDDREKAGKPRKANVRLEAKNVGGDVLIIIKDDGRGINTEKVLKKARENGLLHKQDYEYTEKEIQQFIFMPGFSTTEAVTAYSGRGVGMDVVSSNLALVGGVVLVDSTIGEGTTFTLKIPLTLAIIEGMSVMVAGAQYTIPIVSIIKSFKAKKEDVFVDPSGNEMINNRGEVFNIVRLHEIFNLEGAITDIEEGTLVMIENGDQTVCLLVDKLNGQQQAVLKPMPKYFKKVQGLSGCTLLGNGDISLIVDVTGLFDK